MRVKSIFGFGLLIALAASCALQEPAAPEQDQFPTLSACFENAATKASLAADQAQVVWDANDQIAVFYRTNKSVCYALKGEAGSSSATFAYASGFAAGEPIPYICGFYPYSRDVSLTTDGDFSFEWPAEQVYAEAGFGPGSNPMVAVSESETLYFQNIGGYLVVPIWGEGAAIQSVTLMGANEEPLAGPAVVYAGPESEPSVYMADGAVSEVVLKCTEPVTVGETEDEATEFWFVIPPTVFEEGFGIKIAYADGTEQEVWAESPNEYYEVSRNTVFRMDALCITPEEEPEESNILFWEGFEGYANEDLPNGWTFFDADGDGYNWYILSDSESGNQFKHSSGDGHLTSASYLGTGLYPDNWAITPAIQLASSDNYLSFWVASQDPRYPEKYAVYITTVDPDEAEEEDYTWLFGETFGDNEPDESITVEGGAVNRFIIPIPSEFDGQTVYIAFRHYDTYDMFRLNLDDVMVTEGEPAPGVPEEPDDPNIIFKEDVEGDLSSWSVWDYDGDGYYWEIDDYYSHGSGTYSFTSRSYYGGGLYPDNRLISPDFTLSSESNWLSFWAAPYMESYSAEHLAVYVIPSSALDDEAFDLGDYEMLFDTIFEDDEDELVDTEEGSLNWRHYVIAIPSSLNGEEVCLFFRHFDTYDMFRVILDDIEVTVQNPVSSGPSPAPALPSSISAPYKRLPASFAPAAPVSKQDIQDRPGKPLPCVPFK